MATSVERLMYIKQSWVYLLYLSILTLMLLFITRFLALQDFVFPDGVAYPIGGPVAQKYVVLEVHYDNPELKGWQNAELTGFTIIIHTKHSLTLSCPMKPHRHPGRLVSYIDTGILILGAIYFSICIVSASLSCF